MNTNTNRSMVFFLIVGLVVGGFSGFYFGDGQNQDASGSHLMPDGTLMTNEGMSMQQMMADMNKALMGKTGDEFDKSFLVEMIVHHEGAVEMAKLALTNSKHKEIKDLADAIISAQNKEIGDMKSWLKNWYGVE